MLLIVDGDPICYAGGFAAEKNHWSLVAATEGGMQQLFFDPSDGKTANEKMKAWIAANPDVEILSKDKEVRAEPVSHALEIVRSSLESISKEVAEHFEFKTDSRVLILSGKTNWRDKVATLLPYKGNRDPTHKPVHYQAIRDYMVDAHGARVTDGIEADDMCAMLGWEQYRKEMGRADGYCIASIDKDLDQIPGWHFDYLKKVFYYIDAEDAAKSFWQQVLSGDPTDNIGGCWKIGAGKAKTMIEEWESLSPAEIWSNIVDKYRESQESKGCPYKDRDAEAVALENARLLYLQQRPDELWNAPPAPRGKFSEQFAG